MSRMSRRPARLNRTGLTITGLVLLGVGAAGLIRGLNLLPRLFGAPHTAVVDQAARGFAYAHLWFWIALAAALFVLAVLMVWWLIAQSHRNTTRAMRWEPDPREGVTTLPVRALTEVLHDDLSGSPYLRRARAKFIGGSAHPHLHLAVTVEPDADPAAAKARIREALHRLHHAVEADRLPVTVYIRTGR